MGTRRKMANQQVGIGPLSSQIIYTLFLDLQSKSSEKLVVELPSLCLLVTVTHEDSPAVLWRILPEPSFNPMPG